MNVTTSPQLFKRKMYVAYIEAPDLYSCTLGLCFQSSVGSVQVLVSQDYNQKTFRVMVVPSLTESEKKSLIACLENTPQYLISTHQFLGKPQW